MMAFDFMDFYEVATKLNEAQHGLFCEKEVVEYSYTYWVEYQDSIGSGKPTEIMVSLCEFIVEAFDIDKTDEAFDIDAMNHIIKTYMWED